jgi:diguanylate cyclase (GGDEF)-like protein
MANRPWRIDESAVLAALPDAVAVLDAGGDIVETNAAWTHTFGRGALDRAAIAGRWSWTSADGEPLPTEQWPFAVGSGSGSESGSADDIAQVTMGCRDGGSTDTSWYRVTRASLPDPDGTLSGYVVFLATATEFVRHLHTSRVLAEAGREFRQLNEPEQIASKIAAYAVRLAHSTVDPARRSSLIYIDENNEVARVHSDHDDNEPSLHGVTFVLADHPWVETTVRTGLPLRARIDVDLMGPTVRPYNDGIGHTYAGYAPIMADGKVMAVLTIGSRLGDGIDAVDLEDISALCEISSIAMSEAKLRQAILEQAMMDSLTGLANRRGFDRRLVELPRVPYAIMAIAIDDLKHINDRHGHHAGDELIRLVADTVSGQLRRGDLMARTGGDEFLALFVNAYHSELTRLAERVVSALTEVSFDGRSPRVSIGCAGAAPQAPPETVIAAALSALDRAKKRGKVSIEVETVLVEPAAETEASPQDGRPSG